MLGWVAAVRATESPSQLSPALIQRTWTTASSGGASVAVTGGPSPSSTPRRGAALADPVDSVIPRDVGAVNECLLHRSPLRRPPARRRGSVDTAGGRRLRRTGEARWRRHRWLTTASKSVAFRVGAAPAVRPAGHPPAALRAARLRLRPRAPAPGVPLRPRRPPGGLPGPGPAGAGRSGRGVVAEPDGRAGPSGLPGHPLGRAGPAGVDGRHQRGARLPGQVLRRYQATGTTDAVLAEVEGGWAAALGVGWSPVSSTSAGRRRLVRRSSSATNPSRCSTAADGRIRGRDSGRRSATGRRAASAWSPSARSS